MKQKSEIVEQALVNQGQRMLARGRVRTVLSIVLLLCGGILLYVGISGQQNLFTTIGVVFLLYGLFMRFHIRRSRTVIAELNRELERLTHIDDATKRKGTPTDDTDAAGRGAAQP